MKKGTSYLKIIMLHSQIYHNLKNKKHIYKSAIFEWK